MLINLKNHTKILYYVYSEHAEWDFVCFCFNILNINKTEKYGAMIRISF